MNTVWNCAETRPEKAGVYRTLSEGVEGFSWYDATDKIWGCTQPTIELAVKSPEYEFANQYSKLWSENDQVDLAVAAPVQELGSVPEVQE